jgi:hypothetical protein
LSVFPVRISELAKGLSTEVDNLRLSFKKTFAKISFLFFYFVVLHGNLSNKQLFLTFFKFFLSLKSSERAKKIGRNELKQQRKG